MIIMIDTEKRTINNEDNFIIDKCNVKLAIASSQMKLLLFIILLVSVLREKLYVL